jgi:hypothetical protein
MTSLGVDLPSVKSPINPRSPIYEQFWAVMLVPQKDEPVFHAYIGLGIDESDGREWFQGTKCGREIAEGKPFLPSKHVVKFGRACAGCFPTVPAEFRGPVK